MGDKLENEVDFIEFFAGIAENNDITENESDSIEYDSIDAIELNAISMENGRVADRVEKKRLKNIK